MFDDKTQSNQGIQDLNHGQGAAKVAPPAGLPTGVDSAPASPNAASTLPIGKNETTDDIFAGVNELGSPSPAFPATQPAPLSTAPLGQADGNSAPQIGIGNESQQQPPAIEQQAALPEQMMNGIEDKKISNGKKILIILITVILAVALAGLGYWLYGKLSAEDSTANNLEANDADIAGEEVPLPESEAPAEVSDNGEEAVQDIKQEIEDDFEEIASIDTDGDGLTDEEELVLGTNINEPDSDGDALSDRDEVEVYKTDPLNPDSDGDGYLDGDEVENGYDPKGTGRLFELP